MDRLCFSIAITVNVRPYYAAIADCLFESNWMALPIDLQKLFILMIGHSQKPIFFIKDMGLWN